MKTKHTPGPWMVTDCLDFWVQPEGSLDSGDFNGIAHCGDVAWPGSSEKHDEWLANAHLISAAPNMLEALENLENDDGKAMPPSAWKLVQDAIAKAHGDSDEA